MNSSYVKMVAGGVVGIAAALAVFSGTAGASSDPEQVLGFESADDWTVFGGQKASTTNATQGSSALSVVANGYTSITSDAIGPLGQVSDTVTIDVFLPSNVVDPYWAGDLQMFVSAPSVDVYNQYLGIVSFAGGTPGTFLAAEFQLSENLRASLGSSSATDIQFNVALNVPANPEPYVLDNLQVSSTIPGVPAGQSDANAERTFGFESSRDWTASDGFSFEMWPKTGGNSSVGLSGGGYRVISSVPISDLGPVLDEATLDIFIPEEQPNQWWWGSVGLYVSIPSKGLTNVMIGEEPLTGRPTGEFSTLSFSFSEAIKSLIEAGGYADLSFSIAFNLPFGAATHFFDNLRIAIASALASTIGQPVRDDYVGRTQTGLMVVSIDDTSDDVEVLDTLLKVRAEDEGCVPSEEQVCRYQVNQIRMLFGSFTLDKDYGGAKLATEAPFRMVLGGPHGLVARVPSDTYFNGEVFDSDMLLRVAATDLNIYFTHAGYGLFSLYGSLGGDLSGHAFELDGSIVADSTLVNRPPRVEAGPDLTAVQVAPCLAEAWVDGGESTDFNAVSYRWYWRGNLMGTGVESRLLFKTSGAYVVDLEVEDEFFSVGHDSLTVSVEVDPGCGSIP